MLAWVTHEPQEHARERTARTDSRRQHWPWLATAAALLLSMALAVSLYRSESERRALSQDAQRAAAEATNLRERLLRFSSQTDLALAILTAADMRELPLAVARTPLRQLISVSICYVAVENVMLGELKPWRIALVFAFGLLHGLGFAGVLIDLGLPRGEFATALVAFNLGVETGQLFVIVAAIAAIGWWRSASFYRQRIVIPASLAIAVVAMYWTVQRLG